MDTVTAITERRSVKKYDTSYEMPQEHIDQLLDLAILSPTSFNIQNWRFVVVRDPGQKKRIRAAAWNQAQVEEAQLLLVLCGDLHAWDKSPERYWQNAPPESQSQIVPAIRQFYKDQPEIQRDEAMRSCGMAAQTLMLAAKSMGYDSNPMIGFDPEQVAKIIGLPDHHVIGMMLVIGKAAAPARERGGQIHKSELVVIDRF